MQPDNTDLIQCLPHITSDIFTTIGCLTANIANILPTEVNTSEITHLLRLITTLTAQGKRHCNAVFEF